MIFYETFQYLKKYDVVQWRPACTKKVHYAKTHQCSVAHNINLYQFPWPQIGTLLMQISRSKSISTFSRQHSSTTYPIYSNFFKKISSPLQTPVFRWFR